MAAILAGFTLTSAVAAFAQDPHYRLREPRLSVPQQPPRNLGNYQLRPPEYPGSSSGSDLNYHEEPHEYVPPGVRGLGDDE
jgi:hypothetical protein